MKRHSWPCGGAVVALCLAACGGLTPESARPGLPATMIAKVSKRQCLRPADAALGKQAARPKASRHLASERLPITVHWDVPTTEAYARRVLSLTETAWRKQVTERHWPRPLADGGRGGSENLDVYLEALGPGQAYVAEDARQGKPFAVASCYVGFDRQLPDDGTLESYVMHEFNHASQYALDVLEGDAFYEHTAAFMDRLLVPDNPANQTGIADFQARPWRSLDSISPAGADDEFEYGAALFQRFLSERYASGGDKLVQQLWLAGRQAAGGREADANEPDWIDVLPETLAKFGGPAVDQALTAFEVWRLTESLKQARPFPMPALAYDGEIPARFAPPTTNRPGPWGVNYLRLAASDRAQRLYLTAPGNSRWVLWAGTTDRVGKWLATTVSAPASAPSLEVPAGGVTAYVMVLNLGAGQHDPDRKQWQGEPYRLDIKPAP